MESQIEPGHKNSRWNRTDIIPDGVGQLESRTVHDKQNPRWNRTAGRIPDGTGQVDRTEGIPDGITDGTGLI
jgi:hypothetical protein